ncbi:putative protein kinase RLK-Pelle-CrRLK1L-1 family [Helianthus anomalus]
MESITIAKFAHLQIPLEDVVKATDNFHHDNIIGRGGLGHVYKGQLQRSGELITISALRLDRKHGGGVVEFWTEVSMLSDLKHPNIVSIVGFCDEAHEKIIVTKYEAKNGSLKEHLSNPNLTWTQRLKICVGVARALSYLYYDEGRGYGVIHLNINSSTILLDENWEPKLSGFKVSIKQAVNRMDQVVLSEPIGTTRHMDPEMEKTKGVTQKSDIYSFGVVLFEILCGRRAYIKNDANRLLAPLVMQHYENHTLPDIIHPDLKNQMSRYQISLRSLRIYSKTAYSCLKEEGSHRPHMFTIVNELEKALEKALKFQPRPENFGNNLEHLKIELDDIKLATHNFSDSYKTASSNCYTWYTVELGQFDKENPFSIEGISKSKLFKRHDAVVIKRFLPKVDEHEEELFFTELEVLASFKHHNIVTLIGFCVEGFEMILVTEKFSNGSLGDYLGNVKKMHNLTWEKRLKICIDSAHALNYLHYEMDDKKMMIHSDIDPFRFGLDENWRAKIEDFELAVFLPPNQNDEALCKRTYFKSTCHVDPEYARTGKLKRKSDVYSFGVVMLEILCGRVAWDHIYLTESEKGLVHVARRNFYNGTIEDMIDPTLKEETGKKICSPIRGANKDSLYTFLKVANQCVAETQDQRPTMKVVLNELEKALVFQVSQEEQVHEPNKDQVVDELQITTFQIHVGKSLEHLKIPLTHIRLATYDFSQEYMIADFDDGYAFYRAELAHYDKENPSSKRHNTVLIKRYPPSGNKGFGEKEFLTEMEILSGGVKHPNIVNLLGFCVEASEMILVIDNFSNGFLGQYLGNLKDKRVLTWENRLKICIDVAHALKYIHYEREDQKTIINRDIWSYNIGLDENFGAKIVDFWRSVFRSPDQANKDHRLIGVGKTCYRDPEYEKTRKLKKESDVYGLGVVLFEILCGRLANDPIYLKESDIGLAHVARRSFNIGSLEELIDPLIKEEIGENKFVLNRGPNKDSLRTFITIAHQCVAETQDQRPTMKVVVKELEKALFFQKNSKDNLHISLPVIKLGTQNFSDCNCVGEGRFWKLYEGEVVHANGCTAIVAKRWDSMSSKGDGQFWTELEILLTHKHGNIIGLVGYCTEMNERIIVYEHASNGGLDKHLGNPSLTWMTRLKICIDVANGLEFLHTGGAEEENPVIHRGIKSASIVLDGNWNAKLSNLELSCTTMSFESADYVDINAYNSPGYVDPKYRFCGYLNEKIDIYSLGVILFEMLCGRLAWPQRCASHFLSLGPLAKRHYNENGNLNDMIFEDIKEQIVPQSLTIFQKIAIQCLEDESWDRPEAHDVVLQLKKALEFQENIKGHLHISLERIQLGTQNFSDSNCIGEARFWKLYEGEVEHANKHTTVLAKRWNSMRREGYYQFWTELEILLRYNHENIINLVGYCIEMNEKIIVYEHASNGRLNTHLGDPSLTWMKRIKICIGIANGLEFLHKDQMKHKNIRSGSILLDDDWNAKISNLELSCKRSVTNRDEHVADDVSDSLGYVDPLYQSDGFLTVGSDIYSLGVILVEMLCGKLAWEEGCVDHSQSLGPRVLRHYKEKGNLDKMIFDGIKEQIVPQSLTTFQAIAIQCLHDARWHRPWTDEVVIQLKKALEFQEDYERWESPIDYKEIIRESKTPEIYDSTEVKKHLYDMFFSKGILQLDDKVENVKGNLHISLNAIKLGTQNFSDSKCIGEGRFWKLYEGEVANSNGRTAIIAKRWSSNSSQGDIQFLTELLVLFKQKHENIIGLVGYCNEMNEKVIVYEHAPNGRLDKHLENPSLTWLNRLKICIDVASGLDFLHAGGVKVEDLLIHRDIKSSSILLDGDWNAKISNLEVCCKSMVSIRAEHVDDNANDSLCYVDPKYQLYGYLNKKSDIYSLGMILLEMLSGRLACEERCEDTSIKNRNLDEMIFEGIKKQIAPQSLTTFRRITLRCLKNEWVDRPEASDVIKQLKKALTFQLSSDSSNRERNEMISAGRFSYGNCGALKWRSIQESRFHKAAKIFDTSKLKIQINITPQFLTPGVNYGAYLIFKFCDIRNITSKPMYVNLKYRKGGQNLHAYFATWRDDKWMMIELGRFLCDKKDTDFGVLLESFSRYYCGNGPIYVEGIEFRVIDIVKKEGIEKDQQILKSNSNKDQLSQNEVSGKKHFMLSAMELLYNSSNVKRFHLRSSPESRIQEVIELLPQQVFRINCKIQSQMLSQDTEYVCYLVFKLSEKCGGLHCPVKVRDLLCRNNKEAEIVYFRTPSPWNSHENNSVPEQREDGWMEVKVWKFNSNQLKNGSIRVNLKLITYEGTMSGLVLCGLEFRPM